jgi:hypothetical protein
MTPEESLSRNKQSCVVRPEVFILVQALETVMFQISSLSAVGGKAFMYMN